MSRELLKRAADKLRNLYAPPNLVKEIDAYLAQPEPEPVAWMSKTFPTTFATSRDIAQPAMFFTPLYISPPDQSARPVGVVLNNDGDSFEIEWDFTAVRVLKEGTMIYTTPPDQSARIVDELEEAVIAVNALTTDRNEISQTLGKALGYPFINHDYTEAAISAELADQSARIAELEGHLEAAEQHVKILQLAALQAKREPLSSELLTEMAQQANKAINPYYEFARAIEAAHGIKGK